MSLEENDGHSKPPKRIDEDLPWVLDADRLANWSDLEMYEMEKSFREWLFKAMKSSSWKVPGGKGKWNIGSRMTFDYVRDHFNIEARDSKNRLMLSKLCRYYAIKAKEERGGIKIKGVRHSALGLYFPRYPHSVKKPYCLRLRFELMLDDEKKEASLKAMRIPEVKTAYEMNETRKLQNGKRKEYTRRWREKYGDRYDYSGTDSSTDESSNG